MELNVYIHGVKDIWLYADQFVFFANVNSSNIAPAYILRFALKTI